MKSSTDIANFMTGKKPWMHGYDVDELLYRICDIHGPWVRGSGPRTGKDGHIVLIYMIFINILYSHICKKILIHNYVDFKALYQIGKL